MMYIQTSSRSPLKKTLSSILRNIPDYHNEQMNKALKNYLDLICTSEDLSLSSIKHTTENLHLCMDNLYIGTNYILENYVNVFAFINKSLDFILESLRKDISPQEMTDVYNISLNVIKTLTVILQQFFLQLQNHLKNNDKNCILYLMNIYKCLEKLLAEESTLLNCKINCGIALPLLIKLTDMKIFSMVNNQNSMSYNFEDQFSMYVCKFPSSSQLCLWSGILAGMPIKELTRPNSNQKNFFVNIILPEIWKLTESINDSSMSLACSRIIHQWTDVACKALLEKTYFTHLSKQLSGDSMVINELLKYIWSHWDHFVDGVRHYCKAIFKNILTMHCLSTGEVPEKSQFTYKLTETLINTPWHQRGKYAMLCCLVEQMGSKVLLEISPTFPLDMLNALKERLIASHIAELSVVIYKQDFNEKQRNVWEIKWLKPLLETFCVGTKIQRDSIKEYIIPEIFKISPKSIHFIIAELTENESKYFSTLLMCIKTAQIQGVIGNNKQTDNADLWQSCLPYTVLKKALHFIDHEVQLSAFSLICNNIKTTQPFTIKEFELLKQFLPWCFTSQFPAFRQRLLAELKKLLSRIRDSGNILLKHMKRKKNDKEDVPELIKIYKAFLKWLTEFCFSSLSPGANFPRRYMALQVLLLQKYIFTSEPKLAMALYESIPNNENQAQTLFECLKDTYENNKIAILDLLKSCPSDLLNFQKKDVVKEIFQTSLILASSTKPPESLTAAYLFRLLILHNSTQEIAFNILSEFYGEHDECLQKIKTFSNSFKTTCLVVIKTLLIQLRYHLSRANISLLEAAANNPLYGIITCIRYVLADADLSSDFDKEESVCWKETLSQLITYCFETTNAVSPIVCNTSPEGHLPMDTDPETLNQLQSAVQKAIGRRFETAQIVKNLNDDYCKSFVTIDVMKTRAVTAQMLLLCSWRAHKEVSLLLGDICQKVPIAEENDNGLISCDQILKIGEFFNQQLAEVKHRGAFEQAYIGFSKLCHRLWRSSRTSLHHLPKIWLQELFDSLCGKGDLKLCPTRRSAGVPFAVQALLITEPNVTGFNCFKQAMEKLLDLSRFTENVDAQVHALNILRAIYKDTCLGELVMPFVAEGVKTSIKGFKEVHWGVQNSATLLFTALMTRIFGVNRSKDEPHKKNCMTGRVFFLHFPSLFEFLLKELQEATQEMSSSVNSRSLYLHPTLYPILLLLSRLYPSPVEGCDSNLNLICFVPFVQQAACSSIWKTRILAARALIPLLSPDECLQFLNELFQSISADDLTYQNKLHGKLLQIYYLIQEVISTNNIKDLKEDIYKTLKSNYILLVKQNPCFITRSTFLDIIYLFLSHNLIPAEMEMLHDCHKEFTIQENFCDISVPGRIQYLTLTARTSLLLMTKTLLPEDNICNLLKDVLKSSYYEVRIVALNFLHWIISDLSKPITFNAIPVSSQWKWPDVCKNKNTLLDIIVNSRCLINFLLRMMIQNETQPNCLEELYLLLSKIPSTVSVDWTANGVERLTLSEKLNWVVEKIEMTDWDDLVNAMYHLSVNIAITCYNILCENNLNSEESKQILTVLNKWMKSVYNSSNSNQSISRRMTITKILNKCSSVFLQDKKKILGHNTVFLWNAFILLLQDDEPDIRESCAHIVSCLENENDAEKCRSFTPLLALDILIKQFVHQYNESHFLHCFITLLNWMLMCDREDFLSVQGDEQPFDKGEMNVYLEEITFTNLVATHFTKILQQNTTNLKISSSYLKEALHINIDVDCNFSISDVANKCLEQAEYLLENFSKDKNLLFLSSKMIEIQIQIYQNVKVYLCIFNSTNAELKPVKTIVQQLEQYQPLSEFMNSILNNLKLCPSQLR
ncbi:tRNA (32-2'-O)-methyltransferase regulator THADA isoform X2 [Centruroides vittatus]